MQTLTSREFNQDTAAPSAANDGPVFITDRGRRAYVLISNAEYERLTRKRARSRRRWRCRGWKTSSSSRRAWAISRVPPSSIEPMFLLDTNAVSDLRRPDRAPAGLLQWSRATPPHQQFISCITVFELELGIRQKERRDHEQGRLLRQWLQAQVLPTFDGRILDIDTAVAPLRRNARSQSGARARRLDCRHRPGPRPDRGQPQHARLRRLRRPGAQSMGSAGVTYPDSDCF
jgi:prevent-host-death family protein